MPLLNSLWLTLFSNCCAEQHSHKMYSFSFSLFPSSLFLSPSFLYPPKRKYTFEREKKNRRRKHHKKRVLSNGLLLCFSAVILSVALLSMPGVVVGIDYYCFSKRLPFRIRNGWPESYCSLLISSSPVPCLLFGTALSLFCHFDRARERERVCVCVCVCSFGISGGKIGSM